MTTVSPLMPTRRLSVVVVLALIGSVAPAQQNQPAAEEVVQLDPFQITAAEDGAYTAAEAHTGTIIAVSRDLIPFNTSVLTADLIKDLGIDNASDLSEYLSGVSRGTNPSIADEGGQPSLSFRVRGFASNPLYNGFQTGGRIFSPDSLGRVEASKGPNAVLYGQAPAGGVINFIPKAPRFSDHASLSAGVGTNAYRKASFDVGGPLKLDRLPGELAFRLGGSLLSYEREQIFFESETASAFSAATWRVSPRLAFDFRGEFTKLNVVPSRTAAFVSLGSGPDRVVDPYNRLRNDRNFSYNGPYSRNKTDNYLTTLHGTLHLSDALILRVGGFLSEQTQDSFLLSGPFGLGTAQRVTNARYQTNDTKRRTAAWKADLLWQHTVGSWKVDTLLGYEAHWEESDNLSLQTPPNIVVDIPFTRRPLATDYQEPPPLSGFTELNASGRNDLDWTNVRLTQFIKRDDERLTVMWGLARGEGETVANNRRLGQSASAEGEQTTYTAGATATVLDRDAGALDKVILFANTSTSFNIQGGNAQDPSKFEGFTSVEALRDFARSVPPNAIEPQEGKGFEIGARSRWLDGKVDFTVLYFDQTNENIARNFFVRESNVPGTNSEVVIATFQLAGGEENSKGYELALDWRPVPELTFTGSAQFADGKVKKNPEAPEEIGFGLVSSPEKMISAAARYEFAKGSRLQGLSFGFGLSHNTPTRIRPEIGDRYRISDTYTHVRAHVRYAFRRGETLHSFGVNVENVLDEEYTQEENFLSEPRLWRASYSLEF